MSKKFIPLKSISLFIVATVFISSCAENQKIKMSWDTSQVHEYSFTQIASGESKMAPLEPSNKSQVEGLGELTLSPLENGNMNVSLENFAMSMLVYDPETGEINDTLKNTAPPMILQDVTEKGDIALGSPDLVFDLILKMPQGELVEGQMINSPLSSEFNAGFAQYVAEGSMDLSVLKIETQDGQQIAQLEGAILIEYMPSKDSIQADFKLKREGVAHYIYNVDKQYYESVEITTDYEVFLHKPTDAGWDNALFFDTKSTIYVKIEKRN